MSTIGAAPRYAAQGVHGGVERTSHRRVVGQFGRADALRHARCHTRRMSRQVARQALVAFCLSACSSGPSSSTSAARASVTAQDGGLYIGGPCQRTDGWQPPDPGSAAVLDGSPTAFSPPDAGWVDFNQLPPGIGYCLAPGSVYPQGYYTMNCSVDADCPGNAFCEGASSTTVGQCRRECFTNSDCPAGTTCGGAPKSFCQGTAPGQANSN
jgi:hypothetical protein